MARYICKRFRIHNFYFTTVLLFLAACYFLIGRLSFKTTQYLQDGELQRATDKILKVLNKVGNASISVLPDRSSAILKPMITLPCPRNGGSGLFLLIVVVSAPENHVQREAIRSVYKTMMSQWEELFFKRKEQSQHHDLDVSLVYQVVFFVGQSSSTETRLNVRDEWEQNQDLVVDDFLESYMNLTVKTLRMLKWVLSECGNARFLLKIDDDVFLHMPKMLSFLLSQPNIGNSKLVAGKRYDSMNVIRNPSSKWFVPKIVYAPHKFPPFVAGYCYVLGMKAADEIFKESLRHPLFHLEDVFLTGYIATEQLHYPLMAVGKSVALMEWFDYFRPISWTQEYVMIHNISPRHLRCWTEFTTTETLWPIRKVWPLLLSCFF